MLAVAARHPDVEQPLTIEEFSALLAGRFGAALVAQAAVAVGVSGGPDSMALARLLSLAAGPIPGFPALHLLTVDHGLRAGSSAEAQQVADRVQDWPGVRHSILRWESAAATRIQEEARRARYDLMAGYCRGHGIRFLFLAHHQDDQAETILFRLAKGSGLDGLAGMKAVQPLGDLTLLRPLLDVPKSRLLATCMALGVPFVQDPSNQADRYARVRLRNSAKILAEEGLSSKRLATTARRIERARNSLEALSSKAFDEITLEINTDRIVLKSEQFAVLEEEIALRCLLRAVQTLRPGEDYAPRMEKIEDLFDDLRSAGPFRRRTLAGCVFSRDEKAGTLTVETE